VPSEETERRLFFVINPQAGGQRIDQLKEQIADVFRSPNITLELHQIAEGERIDEIVKQAIRDGFEEFVAVGGDGTVSAVAAAVSGTGHPMGIVPSGTANMLARELNIPLDISEACSLVRGKRTHTNIDALEVNGRCYVYQIVVGPGSEAVAKISRAEKQALGRSVYALAGLRMLTDYRPIKVRAVIDGKTYITWASQVMIVNAGILGLKPFRLGPNIYSDDGKVEVIVMRGRTKLSFIESGMDLVMGNYNYSRRLRYIDGRRTIELSTEPEILVKADGEFIGKTPIKVVVRPGAVKVITPISDEI
jgi:diacylglycerol kinase (ATP)